MIGAVDCGTNSIKLLITDDHGVEVCRESRMVRLGQGVDATGRLADAALTRTFEAIDEFRALLDRHGVDRLRFCATSATRDASNGEEFADGVEQRLGVRPEVLSGDEEAALSYAGAVAHLQAAPAWPTLVIDIGGGSTELILGNADGPVAAQSLNIGSVRMSERHLHSDPPTAAEIEACVADVDRHLDELGDAVAVASARTVVGVAGTITTIAAGVLDLPRYDRDLIDQSQITVTDTDDYVGRLAAMTVEERRGLAYMHPGRVDVIVGGALILERVLRRAGVASMIVSEADILDGIAASQR